jgi:hypothetical protein
MEEQHMVTTEDRSLRKKTLRLINIRSPVTGVQKNYFKEVNMNQAEESKLF